MSDKTTKTDSTTAIDKAIAAAKARKAMKNGQHPNNTPATPMAPTKAKAAKATKEPKEPKRPKVTEEEKAAKKLARETARAEKKALRDAARATKKAEREASRKPAHMSKVQKAAEKLPALNESAQTAFDDIVTNFGAGQVAAIAAHLVHFNRAKATERALSQKLEVGNTVRIISGDVRYIGQTGTVTKAQRIRCFVSVENVSKPVYLFTSDVEVIASDVAAQSA